MKAGDKIQMRLAETATGRIVLHLICMVRDSHVRTHFRGIVREFAV